MNGKQTGARNLIWLSLSAVVVLLDQWTKYLAIHHLSLNIPKAVMPFFNLTLSHNKGSAFGFLNQMGEGATWLFAGVAVAASVFLIFWLYRLRNQHGLAMALSLILGGAVGNLLDRVQHGYVIDFLDFYVGTWHWYAFNIADAAIVLGAMVLLVDAFLPDRS